jgi:hypothetical protein
MVYIKHTKPLTEIKFLGRLTQIEADLLDMVININARFEKMQHHQHKEVGSTSDGPCKG